MQEKLKNTIFLEIDHIIVPLSPLEIVRQFIPKINPENVPHISHEIFHHIFCEIPHEIVCQKFKIWVKVIQGHRNAIDFDTDVSNISKDAKFLMDPVQSRPGIRNENLAY